MFDEMSAPALTRLRVGNWTCLLVILSAGSWAGFYLPLMLIRAVGDNIYGMGCFFLFNDIWWPLLVVMNIVITLVAVGCLFIAGTKVRKLFAALAAIHSVVFVTISLQCLFD